MPDILDTSTARVLEKAGFMLEARLHKSAAKEGKRIASRAIITTMLLAVIAIIFGFVFGRAWCGWLCPLGAILDWITPRRIGRIDSHATWRLAKYILLSIALCAALLAALGLIDEVSVTVGPAALPTSGRPTTLALVTTRPAPIPGVPGGSAS